ncbi:MAG: alpha/beta fold hydrolase [Pirellulales bacterium]
MSRLVLSLILAIAVPARLVWAANVNDFIDFSLRAANNSLLLPGRLYVPPEAMNPTPPRPLILFLHGAGESGTNNLSQINANMDNLLAEAKQRGAFLYAPQTNSGWSPTTVTTHIATMLDRALMERNVDSERLYVTGLSMGGGGTWNMLTRYPERFAAAVPIAAVSPASDFVPANLLDEPIWAFHARNDNVVNVNSTRSVIVGLLNAAHEPLPAFPVRDPVSFFHFDSQTLDLHYSEPATGGHGIWGPVYAFEPMYDWLFAHGIVPEPSSILLISVAVVLLATDRRFGMRRMRCAFLA